MMIYQVYKIAYNVVESVPGGVRKGRETANQVVWIHRERHSVMGVLSWCTKHESPVEIK